MWDTAKEIGAAGVAKSITEFADVEFDAIVDYAGFGTTTAEAIETVGRGGRVVQVGMGKLEPTITTIGFDDIPDGLDKLAKAEVVGRLVALY